jgi:class 3 adenylate cyclase
VLLGRDAELAAIDQALASARLGKSSRLLIRGEPGIGKTALLEYAAEKATSMRVLAARGVEFEADVPFAGLHELLHPTLALLDRLPPIHAGALRSSLGLGARIEADRLIIGAAALGLISAYAEEAPLLITLDDAQWLDRASAEVIAFAARRLFADPIAIIAAVRDDEDSPFLTAGLPELRLQGLDPAAATMLLERTAVDRISPDVTRWMLEATGGNPLALLELGHEAPRLSASPLDNLPIATSVERAYLRRADAVSDGARRVLLLMAASGTPELGVVQRAARALDLKPADVDGAEAARGLVLQRGDHIEFVHPLARAAIYHSAPPADRRAAHKALATVMTAPDDVDRRAWHLAAAASGWDAGAATALDAAARRARERSGYTGAAGAWAESARLTEPLELRATRLFNAADNAWLAGQVEAALDWLGASRTLAQDPVLRVDIESLSGHIAMRCGSMDEGYRTLVGAAKAIEPIDRLKSIRILTDALLSTFGAGQPTDVLADARHAIDMLRPDDPPEFAIFAHVAYGTLVVLAGYGSDGPKHFHDSAELFKAVPGDSADPLLLICACFVGLFLREAEAGRDLLGRAVQRAREHAPTAALPTLLFMLGRDAAATDRWPLARANYEEGARVARETTQFARLAGSVAGLAWLDALEGRADECRAHAAEALELSDQYGMGLYKAWSLIALGQLELGLGRPDEALHHFQSCESLLTEASINDPDISPAPDIVDTLVRLGRLAEAGEVATRYQPSAEAKGQPFALARAARTRALVATDDAYVEGYETALRHHRDTPDVFERARTELYYGERLRRSRRRVEARRHLRDALKAFDQLGAAPWAERAIQELHASGETARVRDDSTRQQLTPQELQVALTLAEGATTREAAARLFLSPKTVEYHLRHVYDKLEVRSRDELKTALRAESRPARSRQALMFTDLAGSTPLVEAIGDAAWHDLSKWMDGEMRRCFAEQRGREVDHAGDGFFVVFDSATDAIECASTIQRRLATHRRLHGYAPQVRIGIHVGEVHASDSTLRGAAVHRTARLCAAAPADGILASREALDASGRRVNGLKSYVLKGIKEPVEAAEIKWVD